MTSQDKFKYLDVALKIITTAVVSYGISKLASLETGVNNLNTQMATIIERSANQQTKIKENRNRIERLENLQIERK